MDGRGVTILGWKQDPEIWIDTVGAGWLHSPFCNEKLKMYMEFSIMLTDEKIRDPVSLIQLEEIDDEAASIEVLTITKLEPLGVTGPVIPVKIIACP